MRKSEIETYYTYGRRRPSVNVKVHSIFGAPDRMLPSEDWPGMTAEWLEENVSDQDQSEWFGIVCGDQYEEAAELAREIFGQHASVVSEGRSGGHLVVDNIGDVEDWDAIMVSKWGRFARAARALADDVPYQMLSAIYLNVYEPTQERAQAKRDELEEPRALALAAAASL